MRRIVVINQKGGVGKTTTTANLGAALASLGHRVLLIDLDPQAHLTLHYGIDVGHEQPTTYDILTGSTPVSEVLVEARPSIKLMPSDIDLAAAEAELISVMGREVVLREALRPVENDFDVMLIDCPPALGLLTLNALVAADAVLVPLQTEFYALEGLSHLIRTIERVKRHLNPKLEIQGIVLTMFDRRNNLCDMVARDVRAYMGEAVYETVIPRNVRVSEAPSHGKPVLLYDMHCAGSQAYIRLAREVLRREKARSAALAPVSPTPASPAAPFPAPVS